MPCQRPRVELRPGPDEPILGKLDADFPPASDAIRDRCDALAQIHLDARRLNSQPSQQLAAAQSACDTCILYWFPCMALVTKAIHATMVLLWLADVTNKRYATRLAMPPMLAFGALATLSRAKYSKSSEFRHACGWKVCMWVLKEWPYLVGFLNTCLLPVLLVFKAAGEIKKESDTTTAVTSCVVGILWPFAWRSILCNVINLHCRLDPDSIDRAVWLWLALAGWSLYNAVNGHRLLQQGGEASLKDVERQFHGFLLAWLMAHYFTIVHRADPALPACARHGHKVSCYTFLLLLLILGPLMQSCSQSDVLWNSWPWHGLIFSEFIGLLGFGFMIPAGVSEDALDL